MTYEELAKKIMEMPKKKRQQEAIVYCDDHAAEDGQYGCHFQMSSSGNPIIFADITD